MLAAELPGAWSHLERRDRWPRSFGSLFLPAAAERIGPVCTDHWHSDTMEGTMAPIAEPFPEAIFAFDVNGAPREQIHILFADSVRRTLSPGRFLSELLNREPEPGDGLIQAIDKRTEALLGDLVPSPIDGSPIDRHLARALVGEDMNDPITVDHWSAAYELSQDRIHLRGGAETALPLVADKLLELFQAGEIDTVARPVGGGGAVRLTRDDWEVDDLMPRLALGGLNLASRMDPMAPVDHWIFVNERQLDEAIDRLRAAEREQYEVGIDATAPSDERTPPPASTGRAEAECRAWLANRFEDPATEKTRRAEFKQLALQRVDRLSGRGFDRAWAAVTENPRYAARTKPGP